MAVKYYYEGANSYVSSTQAMLAGTTYPITNISSIRVDYREAGFTVFGGIMVLIGCIFAFIWLLTLSNGGGGAVFFLLVGAGFGVISLISRRPERYTLMLHTAGGEVSAMSAEEGYEIRNIREALEKAITDQAAPAISITATAPSAPESDLTECPFCAETIKKAAKVCKHCGRDLPALIEG